MNLFKESDFTHKKVLVRVDFNVDPEALSEPVENFRLSRAKETILAILEHPGATVTLITHFGRPEGKYQEEYSTKILVSHIEELLNQKVLFTPDCLEEDVFGENRVCLRENLRFYLEEEQNNEAFAEKLAKGFNIYVNEAFSVCHRNHASVVAITKYLPSVAGLNLEKEVEGLNKALKSPTPPAVAILGGAKIETKLPLIRVFEKLYDFVLLGGIIANEAIDQKTALSKNVLLPVDFRNETRLDIGDETVKRYAEILKEANFVVWNGPMGKFEEAPYDTGTNGVVKALQESEAFIIAGGGESLLAIQKANAFADFNFLSSGGGAMLAYLGGETLPGLEALK